jgi:hypothetical protein
MLNNKLIELLFTNSFQPRDLPNNKNQDNYLVEGSICTFTTYHTNDDGFSRKTSVWQGKEIVWREHTT